MHEQLLKPLQQWLKHFHCHWQPQCVLCDAPSDRQTIPLCLACYQTLPWLPDEANLTIAPATRCISAFAYHAPINHLLLSLKFGKQLREIATLSRLMTTAILPQLDAVPDAILPIPLHMSRLQTRGFNQALELARPLAKQLQIPLLTRPVIRQKATQAQTELDFQQRQQNLHQAFQVRSPLPYRHIAIVDDVITTGATSSELASLLLTNGVERVDIWSCARAILRQDHALTPRID
ncbi:MAG: hypothetical protein RI964_3118 [Pseudomonadota bacterium]|jgi:ComF family protein